MTKAEHQKLQSKMADEHPNVCKEIDSLVTRIAEIVCKTEPTKLLQRAAWGYISSSLMIESELDVGPEEAHSLRMVDYIQSVITSVEPDLDYPLKLDDDLWDELSTSVKKLFDNINESYHLTRRAAKKIENPNLDQSYEYFYYKAQIYWCNIRGDRYLAHDIPHLKELLAPHNQVISELFGISAEQVIEALELILESFTKGPIRAFEELDEFRQKTLEKLEERFEPNEIEADPSKAMEIIIGENNWGEWRDDIMGRVFGLDIFNLQKVSKFPDKLLRELSWAPGEETSFFAEGDYKGWPLRLWPIFVRPFIEIGKRYYCFELYSLKDNFYRIMQRLILRLKPEYREQWNSIQKQVAEDLPFKLLSKIMAGAEVYQSIYYKWKTGKQQTEEWCESDGILIYDDQLFIIEVKAGAFTYTPPTTDFPAYIKSLSALVLKPAEQAHRFLKYLESEEEVSIHDKEHREIRKLKRRRFSNVAICTISLDAFTEMASQSQHLNKLIENTDDIPAWSISIDDLRVYADIFKNPLIFLHYVEQRIKALNSSKVQTEDELDHLGLYLRENHYQKYIENLGGDSPPIMYGYRENIDKFFHNKLVDPEAASGLGQNMPALLKDILNKLAELDNSQKRKCACYLLDLSGEWRESIEFSICLVLEEQNKNKTIKPFSLMGNRGITIFAWQKELIERDHAFAVEHTETIMIGANETERLMLELEFNKDRSLSSVNFKFVSTWSAPL